MDVGPTIFPKVVTLPCPSFTHSHSVERARVISSGAAVILSVALVLVAVIPFVVILITVVGVDVFFDSPPLVVYSLIGLLVVITLTPPTVAIAPGTAVTSK